MSAFAVQDLFAAGLGADIAGGYLVVRGVLVGDVELGAAMTWGGLGHADVLLRIRDRIAARAGLRGLVAGFVLQALGYVLALAGLSSSGTSLGRALVAGALAIGGAGVVLVAWLVVRRSALRRDILAVARVRDGKRVEAPLRGVLLPMGEMAGFARRRGEADEAYAGRVFGVTAFYADPDPY